MSRLVAMIFRELRFRLFNTTLSVAGVAAAAALCTAAVITQQAAVKETRRTMRDMGSNIRIIPREADANAFLLNGYTKQTMPERAVDRLVEQSTLSYNHIVATLRQPLEVDGVTMLVVGLADPKYPPGQEKPPMVKPAAVGTAQVGHALAKRLGATKGGTVDLNGHTLTVARVIPEFGTADDLSVFTSLVDAQQILGLSGQISEIRAIDCRCLTADQNPVQLLRTEIERLLPEAQVFHLTTIADARAKQRQMTERYASFAVPTCAVLAALWVGALSAINVRDRRNEIGLLRAIGKGGGAVGGLFLGRALVVGAVGSALGLAAGAALAIQFGPKLFPITAKGIQLPTQLGVTVLLVGTLLAALAAVIPTVVALNQDPAHTLRPD